MILFWLPLLIGGVAFMSVQKRVRRIEEERKALGSADEQLVAESADIVDPGPEGTPLDAELPGHRPG